MTCAVKRDTVCMQSRQINLGLLAGFDSAFWRSAQRCRWSTLPLRATTCDIIPDEDRRNTQELKDVTAPFEEELEEGARQEAIGGHPEAISDYEEVIR